MKKIIPIFFIIFISLFSVSCSSSSEEKLYGWWKPENGGLIIENPIFISKDEINDGKANKILNWKKDGDSYAVQLEQTSFTLGLTEDGKLSLLFPGASKKILFTRTTEEEVKKMKMEREKKFKEMTTSHPDPF